MAGTSVDGLVSGLDTTTIISQLMQIEAQSQTRLKTQLSDEKLVVSAYQALNAVLKTATDSANALDTPTDWQVYSATSTSTNVSAAATATASPGTLTFNVKALATPHSVLYSKSAAATAAVADKTIGISLAVGGKAPVNVAVGDGSLQGVVDGINSAGLGVRAGLIKVTDAVGAVPATFRLQLTSTATGEASRFAVTGLDSLVIGDDSDVRSTGNDAVIQFGSLPTDTVKSSSNTFAGVFPGVTLTVSKVEDNVAVTVGTDTAGLQTKVKSLVDAVNAALTQISSATAYNANTKTGGSLLGQQLPTRLQGALRNSLFGGTSTSLASIGIQLDKAGQLTLDAAKLSEALKADPASVQALVAPFATRVADVAGTASKTGGEISSVIDGRNTRIKDLNDSIADWDVRLAARQASLKKTYAALETALGSLKSQGDWLAGQIAGLPTYNQGND
jgi:flagellar hook-associated protein 2